MMNTSIAGIPCLVDVTHYQPADSGSFFEPPSGPEIEYEVYDRKGYRANWLMAKITDADDRAILDQYESEREGRRVEAEIAAHIAAHEVA